MKKYICVISDASGLTAERVVKATLAQFGDTEYELERIAKVKTEKQIKAIVEKTKKRKGLIAYTLVDTDLRSLIAAGANEADVAAVDLMGPLLNSLSLFLSAAPAYQPGLYETHDEESYQRLDAIRFTVHHDDGLSLHELPLADLVIVGPSRTSKTPLCAYLAHTRGLKMANVPLIQEFDPPEELKRLAPEKVVGLTMNARVLAAIRRVRARDLGVANIQYAQMAYVEKDLRHCHQYYRQPPAWGIVDVTNKSIEEVAVAVCAKTIDGPKRTA